MATQPPPMYTSPTTPSPTGSPCASNKYNRAPLPHSCTGSIVFPLPVRPYFKHAPPVSVYPYIPLTRSPISSDSFFHTSSTTSPSSSHTTSLTFFNAHGNSPATFSNSPAPVHHTVTPASRNCPATFLGPCFPLPPTFTAHPPLPNVRNTSTLPHSPPKPHSCPTTHSPSSSLSPTLFSLLFFPLS